jgi:glycosyltransferase involved in cell wall biosynthesis
MRIAFIADPVSPNGWYRGIGPMVALEERGHEARQIQGLGGEFRAELARDCDVLHIHRDAEEQTLGLVRWAKQAGLPVIYDDDDDLGAIPKNNVSAKTFRGLAGARIKAAVTKIVQSADLVTAPTPVLTDKFAAQGAKRVEVIENFARDEILRIRPRERRNGDDVTIGWMAGSEHHLDIERVPIRDALQRLIDTHDHVRVVSIGAGLGLRGDRFQHIPSIPFKELLEPMSQFDIGLAVIADIPFNYGRSNLKVKEYAALGIPWLASPIGPYADLGEQQGGRLVPDDRWYEALERLVLKPRERKKLAKKAFQWGRKQAIGSNIGQWEHALATAIASARDAS